jgi:AraC-like DNA-binding protein
MMCPDPKHRQPRRQSAPSSFPPLQAGQHAGPSTTSALRRFDELCGSEIIHARFQQRSFAPHTHDTWTIGWVEQGANRFRRGRTQCVANAGSVCVVNPGDIHTGGGAAMTYWNLMPSDALLARVFPETPLQHLFLRDAVVTDALAVAAVRSLFASFADAASPLVREQAVLDGLVGLFMGCQRIAPGDLRQDQAPAAVRRARDYIDAHLDESLSLATLAGVARLSPFHFCRVFEAAHGMPPAAYVRQRRVHLARQLIEAGAALADAAARAGFADQPHMTRQFRAVLGVTPAQWRA